MRGFWGVTSKKSFAQRMRERRGEPGPPEPPEPGPGRDLPRGWEWEPMRIPAGGLWEVKTTAKGGLSGVTYSATFVVDETSPPLSPKDMDWYERGTAMHRAILAVDPAAPNAPPPLDKLVVHNPAPVKAKLRDELEDWLKKKGLI